jgi:hypothetical protein
VSAPFANRFNLRLPRLRTIPGHTNAPRARLETRRRP